MSALTVLSEVTATAGKLGGGESLQIPVARIVLALLICSVLAFCFALLIKHRGRAYSIRELLPPLKLPPQEVRILEVRRIGIHGDVALIQHRDRRFLVLVQAGNSTVLREEVVDPAEVVT